MQTAKIHPNMRRNRFFATATLFLMAVSADLAFAQSNSTASSNETNDKRPEVAVPQAAVETSTTDKEIVVMDAYKVTGSFRGSLSAAAQIKENNQAIVEVVAAEDIGKLPDTSIADSLTRLTGLTTQRTNGRSQAISIRGLTGDFSTATLNGREQVSTGLNRAVEFDQYPAELLSGVVVYKTASANLTAQGLAGTVDLQTVHPLSKSNRTIAISSFYDWTQLGQLTPGAKKTGERFSLSYIDKFDDGKLGIALGYAYTSKPFEGQQFQAWGYPTDPAGNFALGGTKSYVRTSNLDRNGFMGVIEYKPDPNLHSTIDFYHSNFKEKQLLRGLEIPLAFWSSAQLQPGYTVQNGLITSSTLSNVQPVVRNDTVNRTDNLTAAGWNLQFGDGTGWTTVFDAGYSRIVRKDQNLETYSGLGFAGGATTPDVMTVKLIPGKIPVFTPTVNYSNTALFKLTDPQGWGTGTLPVTGMQGYLKYFQSKDELGQFKLLTRHEMNWFFNNFEVGVSYTDRFKRDGEKPTGYLYNANGQPTAALPPIVGTTDLSFLGLGRVYAYDPLAAYNSGVYGFYPNPNNDVIANRWKVTEKITRLYVQFDIDKKIGSVPVSGNLGFQAIHADQSSTGFSATGSGGSLVTTPVSGSAKYTDFAPSLNLKFKVADETFVRFSAARQIARPRMYDMKAGRTFNYNSTYATSTNLAQSPWSGDGGNPNLKPWRSDSFDLSFEKYFKNNMGYFSLTAFHKNLLTYVYQQSTLESFSGYPISGGTTPALSQGTTTTPVNGQGGSLKGAEATLSLPSELFWKELKGLGIVLGGAYTDSSIQPWGPTNQSAPIAGLSRKVANATLYYERKGFSARVSERYRSETREYITTFGPPNFKGDSTPGSGFSLAQPEKVVDAQVSYALQSGQLKGLTFYLQAYNLNNEPLITYNNGDARQVMNYQKYGASHSAGVAYKF
jgi:iron complex outermembrane receptor protein